MRRIMLLVTVALVMAAMMVVTVVTASSAFAFPGDTFPPSQAQGPSENAFGGLTTAVENTQKPKPNPRPPVSDLPVIKLQDKATPSIG
jgi:hypothetical protein